MSKGRADGRLAYCPVRVRVILLNASAPDYGPGQLEGAAMQEANDGNPNLQGNGDRLNLHPRLRELLLAAYDPCPAFTNHCSEMRWAPAEGHVPRGFCGAVAALEEVRLVLVVAEPGDPHPGETHFANATVGGRLDSAYAYAYECFKSGKDLFHRNVRQILDLCWPDLHFDAQMHRTWITESVLCSARIEGGFVSSRVWKECRSRYLERELALFPEAIVVALGSKAQKRLAGMAHIIRASA